MDTDVKKPKKKRVSQKMRILKIRHEKDIHLVGPALIFAANEYRIANWKSGRMAASRKAHDEADKTSIDPNIIALAADAHKGPYVHPIPMTKLYKSIGVNNLRQKRVVQLCLSVYFERRTRGNNKSKQCSKWRGRDALKVPKKLATLIDQLSRQNAEYLLDLRKVMFAKADGQELVMTATFACKDKETAAVLADVLNSMAGRKEEEPEPENCFTTPSVFTNEKARKAANNRIRKQISDAYAAANDDATTDGAEGMDRAA